MTPEQQLLSDLGEVSRDLRDWAEDKLHLDNCSAQDVIDILREAVYIVGRD